VIMFIQEATDDN